LRRIALPFLVLAVGLVSIVLSLRSQRGPAVPPTPAVVERVRETARLETLQVSLYRKISFAPEPVPAGSLWRDVLSWVAETIRPSRGRAIVFADAHVGFDLARIGPEAVRVEKREVWVALPPLVVTVELKPGETEVIDSNLDSAETAQLLERAREAFHREVESDPHLRERARRQAERALRELLTEIGFWEVHFVDRMPAAGAS
jgi:hypothetical protein